MSNEARAVLVKRLNSILDDRWPLAGKIMSAVDEYFAHERRAGAAQRPTAEDLGWVLYEMGVDDLSLDDARKLAAHIVVRLVANDDDPFRDERTGRTGR